MSVQLIRNPFRLLSFLAVAIMMVGLSLVTSLGGIAGTPKQAHAQTNWVLQWSDEFSGASGAGVDTNNWKYDTGQGVFGTGEIETMTTSTANVFQDGQGHLHIKALRDASGNWTSGRIETQRSDFQPAVGGMMRVESSFQQPNLSGAAAAGYWPAFWMLGATLRTGGTWPSVGEWDVMEDINGLSSVFGTLHCGTNPGGPCNESTGIGSGQRTCTGCQTAMHTYAIEYDRSVSPEQLRWYLDGVNYFTINSSQLDATTWNNATHRGNFIIYDLAMGGGFPNAFGGGPTSSTQSGGEMIIDYVRVYYSGSASGPTATPIPPTKTNTPVPSGDGTPYTGTPYAIPGKVEAENFNKGGEGVAYHDTDTTNNGGQYRTTEGVDIEATTDTGGGYDVGWTAAGEWMKYTVNVASAGKYNFDFRVASAQAGGTFHMEVDNANVTGSLTVPNTGGWQNWTDVTASNISLSAGQHVFKWATDAAGGNYNWFNVTASASPTPTFVPPTTTPSACGTTNLALNKPATSSSNENSSFTAPMAVDGNTGTRWSSAFSDPQWLQVDLGSTQNICHVKLNWETAYGKAYQIQVSNDATTWTTIYSTTTGTGGVNDLTGLSGSGRYIRMYGTVRATQYGYSLWEFEVYVH